MYQIQWNKKQIFLDALSESDARWDGKQEFFYLALFSRLNERTLGK